MNGTRGRAAEWARDKLAPALAAFVFAAALSAVVLLLAGADPGRALAAMAGQLGRGGTAVDALNTAAVYSLAGIAVSVGFAMNLFNIGVEGQYRVAAVAAAVVGGAVRLPAGVHAALILLVAVAAGALYALIPALLKVYRGVHEVISTIMLNAVGAGIVSWSISERGFGVLRGNNIGTAVLARSAWVPGWHLGSRGTVFGLAALAVLVGVGYWVLLARGRFGFELRATGESPTAAATSGIDPKRTTLAAMLLSGAVAGLVAMPELVGRDHAYLMTSTTGYGFTGIAVALLGRGHPVGVAVGALLWSFLDKSAVALDGVGIPREIVMIMQGSIVLAVVVSYRVAGRRAIVRQQRTVRSAALGAGRADPRSRHA
ncbi:MAG: ABC transporter permease [Mycobacteriaceae bacterium]|nr:ABC transporter permease [Mycobacteriaceae bacterium]